MCGKLSLKRHLLVLTYKKCSNEHMCCRILNYNNNCFVASIQLIHFLAPRLMPDHQAHLADDWQKLWAKPAKIGRVESLGLNGSAVFTAIASFWILSYLSLITINCSHYVPRLSSASLV